MRATIYLTTAIAGVMVFSFQGTLHAQLPKEPQSIFRSTSEPPIEPQIGPKPQIKPPIDLSGDWGFTTPKIAKLLVRPNDADDRIKKLQREQLAEAIVCVEVCKARFDAVDTSGPMETARDLLHKYQKLASVAAFDLAETSEQKIECLEFLVDAAKVIERIEVARSRNGSALGASAAKYWRLEAEINLLKFKRDLAPRKAQ